MFSVTAIRSIRSLVLFALLTACQAFAQRYNFRVYAEAEGLTDLNVNSMLQDHQGFLWVATRNGLFRFDGHRFRRYGVEAGIPSAEIWTILETSGGRLWIVTRGGVARRLNDRFEKVDIGDRRLPFGSNDLAEDRTSAGLRVYLTTKQGLLWFADNRGHGIIPGTDGQPIWSVAPAFAAGASAPGVWYARSDGVCYWNGNANRCYGPREGITDGPIGGLVVDHAGGVWARSARHLMVLAPGESRFTARDSGISYSSVRGHASLDARGMPMIPTEAGLLRWMGRNWAPLGAAEGLAMPSTSWGLEDNEGSIWIGMQGGGIARWLGSGEWENWTQQQGLANDRVWSMQRDRRGRLLIGSSGGIDSMEHGKLTHIRTAALEAGGNWFRALAVDTDNSVWVGTSAAGLARIDGRTGAVTHFFTPGGIMPELIGSIVLANRPGSGAKVEVVGNTGVFAGTRRGDKWQWEREAIPQADAEVFVNGAGDRAGRIWVGTTMGLAVREKGRWLRLGEREGLPARLVEGLAEDPDGSMIVAYVDSLDLFRIAMNGNARSVTRIPFTGNRAPTSTYFIGFDRGGNLWRGTGSGVYVRTGGHWIQYTRQDGLVWNGTNTNAFYADPDGSVWIGTARGLSHHVQVPEYRALLEQSNAGRQQVAAVYVVDVQAGGKSVPMDGIPQIDYKSSNVFFRFASPVFRRDKDVRFRYRLRGYHEEWTETSDWEAEYSSLTPGNYRFEVRGGTLDGHWSANITALPVVVTGPLWQARWFTPVCLGLLLGLAGVGWRLRDVAQVRSATELRTAVRLRTAELERERGFESTRNRILEALVSEQSLAPVLDDIARLVQDQIPGSECVIVLKQGPRWRLGSPAMGSKAWLEGVLDSPGGIPPMALQGACRFPTPGFGTAVLRISAREEEHASDGSPVSICSVPIGLPEAQGVVLLRCPEGDHAQSWQPILETGARMAQVALEHHRFCDNLEFQARHDGLTGLANRAMFEEELKNAINEAGALKQKLAVLFIDLDGFKQINDRLTHRAGDAVLREIARRMEFVLRDGDTAARIGGDEFNILIPDIAGSKAAEDVATRLLESIGNVMTIEGRPVSLTASAGIALFPDDSRDAGELQRQADAAMYHAKSLGKNRIACFSSETLDCVRMEQELQHALREGWFVVEYQPIYPAAGELKGFEALLRLRHPTRGVIPPLSFIPLAENTGLIVPIGAWVLDEVCRQIAEWMAQGLRPVPVAVNVSGAQIVRGDFARTVAGCLERHGLAAKYLELELTESMIIAGAEDANRQMHALRALGIAISIDDFGTGYSSLSCLHQLAVDTIKLDRSFVKNIDTDAAAKRLVEAVVGVAKGLGLSVIAEGVETDAQRRTLTEANCTLMQGFLFGRPGPPAEAERLLRSAFSCSDDLRSLILAGTQESGAVIV